MKRWLGISCAIFGGMGFILGLGYGFYAVMSAITKGEDRPQREYFGCEVIPYGAEIHNKITPDA
jgi:hypothetical protein